MKYTPDGEKLERCVLCGALTAVPVALPVHWREDFVPGCGQLCVACGQKLRGKKHPVKIEL